MDKYELLYDHYKETFLIIKENIDKRNRFFVMLFITISLQFLFTISSESITSLLINIIKNSYDIDISGQIIIIQCLLWLILLYLTMRYYQSTVYIERQYNFIHSLEDKIAKSMKIKFDRESGNYLKNYPKMNSMIDFLYKWVFPTIYCIVICCKIINEINISNFGLPIIFDTVIFVSCFSLTILYLLFLHKKTK